MTEVSAVAVAVSDDDFPVWLEVRLRAWDGSVVTLVEKCPVLGVEPDVALPVAFGIGCDVRERHDDGSATVRLHHSIEDSAGRGVFRVRELDLGEG